MYLNTYKHNFVTLFHFFFHLARYLCTPVLYYQEYIFYFIAGSQIRCQILGILLHMKDAFSYYLIVKYWLSSNSGRPSQNLGVSDDETTRNLVPCFIATKNNISCIAFTLLVFRCLLQQILHHTSLIRQEDKRIMTKHLATRCKYRTDLPGREKLPPHPQSKSLQLKGLLKKHRL